MLIINLKDLCQDEFLTSTMKYSKQSFSLEKKQAGERSKVKRKYPIQVIFWPERPSSHRIISLPWTALAEVSYKTFSLVMRYPNAGIFQKANENLYENQDLM